MVCRILGIVAGLMMAQQLHAADYIVKHKYKGPDLFNTIIGAQLVDVHEDAQLSKIHVDTKNEIAVLAELYSDSSIEYVVPNFRLQAFRRPPMTDQGLKRQWAVEKVNAKKAWNSAGNRGSQRIIVAVIDTGVDYRHKSLAPNMVPGYDFKDKDSDPMDKTSMRNPGHGTHCAGVVGATGLVDGGIIGMSPTVAIMPLRFLGADGGGDLMDGIRAIDHAISKGAHVISASWGAKVSKEQAKPLIEAVERADKAGVIFVAAAANDGKSNDRTSFYPTNANTPNMIAVAASNSSDGKPSWSNYGKAMVSLAAPGENIMSTLPSNKYGNLSGTSMATPLVSGLVALLKAQSPDLTGAEAKALLQATGAKAQVETNCNCRVDAGAAMDALVAKKMIVVPNAMTVEPSKIQQFSALHAQGAVTFKSSNPSVATIDDTGMLKAVSKGETQITATDASNNTATSLTIRIANLSDSSGGGGGGGGGGGQCPFPDEATCDMICQFQPDLPWCKK